MIANIGGILKCNSIVEIAFQRGTPGSKSMGRFVRVSSIFDDKRKQTPSVAFLGPIGLKSFQFCSEHV